MASHVFLLLLFEEGRREGKWERGGREKEEKVESGGEWNLRTNKYIFESMIYLLATAGARLVRDVKLSVLGVDQTRQSRRRMQVSFLRLSRPPLPVPTEPRNSNEHEPTHTHLPPTHDERSTTEGPRCFGPLPHRRTAAEEKRRSVGGRVYEFPAAFSNSFPAPVDVATRESVSSVSKTKH